MKVLVAAACCAACSAADSFPPVQDRSAALASVAPAAFVEVRGAADTFVERARPKVNFGGAQALEVREGICGDQLAVATSQPVAGSGRAARLRVPLLPGP